MLSGLTPFDPQPPAARINPSSLPTKKIPHLKTFEGSPPTRCFPRGRMCLLFKWVGDWNGRQENPLVRFLPCDCTSSPLEAFEGGSEWFQLPEADPCPRDGPRSPGRALRGVGAPGLRRPEPRVAVLERHLIGSWRTHTHPPGMLSGVLSDRS